VTPENFIRANAGLAAPPLVPEIRLYLATEVVPLWSKTEDQLARTGVPPPYWAFAWAGGQALARHVLDNPGLVDGKQVLDLGAGSGLVGIAAAKAGAARVLAADIDSFACAAIVLNAKANAAHIEVTSDDVIGTAGEWQTILVGDLFYERPLAERLLPWLAQSNADVLLGDPGRSYFPREGLERLAEYAVATSRELEDTQTRRTGVWRLLS
jgi:predicted nicotinamide N-methyase